MFVAYRDAFQTRKKMTFVIIYFSIQGELYKAYYMADPYGLTKEIGDIRVSVGLSMWLASPPTKGSSDFSEAACMLQRVKV